MFNQIQLMICPTHLVGVVGEYAGECVITHQPYTVTQFLQGNCIGEIRIKC